MSDHDGPNAGEWPTHCPLCGTELTSAVIDLDTTNENRAEFTPGEMVAVDYCPNPDCPGKNAEAPASGS
jgi:hypothetical protein